MEEWRELIDALAARLPELERQVLKFGNAFPCEMLPQSVFQTNTSAQSCLTEIRQDLKNFRADLSWHLQQYMVLRLSQKIHVLVDICRIRQPKSNAQVLEMEQIGTRVKWLQQQQEKQEQLTLQRAALSARLVHLQSPDARQRLQVELAAIDVQLRQF